MLKTLALAVGGLALAGAGVAADISGAGATFPAPLYARWAQSYARLGGGRLNYQAIGSGGGIKQIKARTVDFGASDKPLKPAELQAAGLYQFPTVVGGVVPIVNLRGLRAGRLRLTGELLADMYLGKVTRWNDPRIVRLNPQLGMPNVPLTVVHRSDGSGTSFLFTSYLAAKNGEFAKRVGANDSVQWPTGLGGKGNDGVAAFVKQTMGAIGYVEYAYAKQNNAAYALVANRANRFPAPVAANFGAAAASAQWAQAPGNYLLLIDQPGANTWPITGATFILLHRNQTERAKGQALLKFFDWAYTSGDAAATALDYVPLPPSVKAQMRQQWRTSVTTGGQPVYVAN